MSIERLVRKPRAWEFGTYPISRAFSVTRWIVASGYLLFENSRFNTFDTVQVERLSDRATSLIVTREFFMKMFILPFPKQRNR
jgi:hypothetical protein